MYPSSKHFFINSFNERPDPAKTHESLIKKVFNLSNLIIAPSKSSSGNITLDPPPRI